MTLDIYTANNLTRTHSLQTATIIYFYLKELQIMTVNYFVSTTKIGGNTIKRFLTVIFQN